MMMIARVLVLVCLAILAGAAIAWLRVGR